MIPIVTMSSGGRPSFAEYSFSNFAALSVFLLMQLLVCIFLTNTLLPNIGQYLSKPTIF